MGPLDPAMLGVILVGYVLAGWMVRHARLAGGGHWATGWALLIAAGIAATWTPPAPAIAGGLGTAFFGLMLVGSLHHVGRPAPRALLPAVAVAAIAHALTVELDRPREAAALALVLKTGFAGSAAWVVHRAGPARSATIGARLLPVGLVGLGVVGAADTVAALLGAGVPWALWVPAMASVLTMQIIAILEQTGRRAAAATEALGESVDRAAAITDSAYDLIAELDDQGRFQYASPSWASALGYEQEALVGTNILDLVHPEVMPGVKRTRRELDAQGSAPSKYGRVRHRDGSWRWLESNVRAFRTRKGEERLVLISRDVTERIRSERRRRESQKLESLGLVAGGVAHDFNNLLAVVLGNASLARAKLEPGSEAWRQLTEIEGAAESAAALTRQLLAYAGGGDLRLEPMDFASLVERTAKLLAGTLPEGVELDVSLAPDLPAIEGDPGSLQQVVMNLVANAVDASDGGGVVQVSLRDLEADRSVLAPYQAGEPLEPGAYLELEVSDSGCGMDEKTAARMFDPFFSTKGPGRGLGLASLLGIVRGHGGALRVDSRPGAGSRIGVLLPATRRPIAATTASPEPPRKPSGGGTVLVADDEEAVSRVAKQALEAHGFRVRVARDGTEALRVLERNAEEIVALVLDLAMPVMGGAEVLRRLRAEQAELPVVLTSGFGRRQVEEQTHSLRFARFLQKPFRAERLVEVVVEALGEAAE